MIKVFIDGKSGTTGLGIYERMERREDVTVLSLPEEKRKSLSARKEALNEADIAFLCLPDDAAREAVSLVENGRTIVIDASTAHRTEEGWAYGFPELGEEFAQRISSSRRIANPGCHASGFLALARPLVVGGFVEPDYPFAAFSVTGYTGGGKKMIAEYEGEGRDALLEGPRAYGLTEAHKHLPEMTKYAGLTSPPLFVPTVGDFPRGMCVTVPIFARMMAKKADPEGLFAYFAEYYAKQSTIQVTQKSEDGYLSAVRYAGTDGMEIFVGGNAERILLAARFDNLGKGASGAAVQNMNLALGKEETLSLELPFGA